MPSIKAMFQSQNAQKDLITGSQTKSQLMLNSDPPLTDQNCCADVGFKLATKELAINEVDILFRIKKANNLNSNLKHCALQNNEYVV